MELSKSASPKKKFHVSPEEREKECPHPRGFIHRSPGQAGPKVCPMCGEREDSKEGKKTGADDGGQKAMICPDCGKSYMTWWNNPAAYCRNCIGKPGKKPRRKKPKYRLYKREVESGEIHGRRTISESELLKCGGLYRIRENYEPVWRMEADEEGRRYIVRADGGGAEAERIHITEGSCAEDSAKNADEVAKAFKIIRAGATYVVWECEACSAPNMTKYSGREAECDQCHKKYAQNELLQVGQTENKYTRAEVQAINPEFAARMGRLGISKIHTSLLKVWAREEMKCEKCGKETEGTKLCLSCSPKGTLFKQKGGARRTPGVTVDQCSRCKEVKPLRFSDEVDLCKECEGILSSERWREKPEKK